MYKIIYGFKFSIESMVRQEHDFCNKMKNVNMKIATRKGTI